MPTLTKILIKKNYLRRITGVKHEKFEKITKQLKPAWRAVQKRKQVAGRPYGVGELREHLLLLLMYYRTYTTHLFLAQIFKVDEATICRAIQRIAPLAELVLKIKPEKLLSENDLQLLIVDATEQRIERPKNQRNYYSGKKHAHTIKTEIVTDSKGRILRVSKPYEGRVHDFEIRKTEGPLPAVPILADSGYQGLQNEHSAAAILPKKKPKNGSLSASEQARNTKLARCRIVIEHTFAHLKKWNILAACYRGPLSNYPQIFQTIAGLHNFLLVE